MTKLNHEKLRHLRRATADASSSIPVLDLAPIRPLERLALHNPFPKWCRRCGTEFPYEGVEERPPLIRCCPDCRSDLEHEAGLNGMDRNLPDDVLVEAIKGVAAAEERIAVEGHLAARAREAENRSAADRHRRRMVRASVEKEAILDRHRPRKITLIRRPTVVLAARAEVDAGALAA